MLTFYVNTPPNLDRTKEQKAMWLRTYFLSQCIHKQCFSTTSSSVSISHSCRMIQ